MNASVGETQDAPPGERDFSRLCSWLSDNTDLGQNCRVTGREQPKNGFSADTLLLSIASDKGAADIVVRIAHTQRNIFLDASIERQARFIQLLYAQNIPVPQLLGWDNDEAVLGAPFLVMRRAGGVSLPQSPSYHVAGPLIELTPEDRARAWREALETIANINRIDWRADFSFLIEPAYGEPGLDHYLGWVETWRNQACAPDNPIIDTAITYLRENLPVQTGTQLLWGDSNPGNFLFGGDGSVTAALDFEAASIGPAEIDLGWWFMLDRMLAAGNPLPEGMPDREGQIAIFEQALGRKVHNLDYFEILAALRMSLVIARCGSILIEAGSLPADNQVTVYNPASAMLAGMLGLPADLPMDDYFEMVRVMNDR